MTLKIRTIYPDGDCFFKCLQTTCFPDKPVLKIRQEVVDFFLKQKKYCAFYGIQEGDIRSLYHEKTWDNDACDHIVKIASQKYNLTIVLYCPSFGKKFIVRPFSLQKPLASSTPEKRIALRLMDAHYDIIEDEDVNHGKLL